MIRTIKYETLTNKPKVYCSGSHSNKKQYNYAHFDIQFSVHERASQTLDSQMSDITWFFSQVYGA